MGHKVSSFEVALLIEGRVDPHQAQVLVVFPRIVNFDSIVDIAFRLGDNKFEIVNIVVDLDCKFQFFRHIVLENMSHNSKYYLKKIKRKPPASTPTIDILFRKVQKLDNSYPSEPQCTEPTKSVSETECQPEFETSSQSTSQSETTSEPPTSQSVNTQSAEHDAPTETPTKSDSEPLPMPVVLSQPDEPTVTPQIDKPLPLPEESSQSNELSLTPSKSDNSMISLCSASEPMVKASNSEKVSIGPKYHIATKYEFHYEWLFYSFARAGYCCKYCQVQHETVSVLKGSSLPFVNGTELGDHPFRKLSKHQESKQHKDAIEATKCASSSQVARGQQNIGNMLQKRQDIKVDTNRKYMSTLISSTYFLIKQRWALDSVAGFISHLQRENCPNIAQYHSLNPQYTYTSSTSVSDIVTSIDQVFEDDLLKQIREAKYIGILADESTDEANRAQFAVLIRLFINSKIEDHFVGIIHVKRTTAEALMDSIQLFLDTKGIDIAKIMFTGFDGCNTMSGENKGI